MGSPFFEKTVDVENELWYDTECIMSRCGGIGRRTRLRI